MEAAPHSGSRVLGRPRLVMCLTVDSGSSFGCVTDGDVKGYSALCAASGCTANQCGLQKATCNATQVRAMICRKHEVSHGNLDSLAAMVLWNE
jgi:hypothetical protein